MDNRRSLYEKESRALIKSVTGFQEDEENFDICLNYAVSHFISDNYLDVDWFKIKRRIAGFCERYRVDLEHSKAKQLQVLSAKYLEILDAQTCPEKVTGYAMLALLCNLSGSLDNEAFFILNNSKNSDSEENDFNWSKYLREDDLKVKDVTDSDDSVWSESDEDTPNITLHLPSSPAPLSVDSGIGETPDSCYAAFPPLEPFRPYQEPTPPKEPYVLQNPYWNPRTQVTKFGPKTNDFHSNFTRTWEEHLVQHCPLYTPETNTILTEKNVLREMLWMFHGVKKTFLFPWVDGQFQVKKHIHLSHLTEPTLNRMVSPLCRYGNKMVQLVDFIESTQKGCLLPRCQVIEAYAKGLQSLLHEYRKVLTSCEKVLINQKETVTFFKLMLVLQPQLTFLLSLHDVHTHAISNITKHSSSFECATRLLDSLWCHLAQCNLWSSKSSDLQAVLKLFLLSFRPYVRMLEGAITRGELCDPHEEFFVKRNRDKKITDADFWEKGFNLRPLPDMKQKFFLEPLFNDVLVASKSIQMLCSFKSGYQDVLVMESEHSNLFADIISRFIKLYESLICRDSKSEPKEKYDENSPDESTTFNLKKYDAPLSLGQNAVPKPELYQKQTQFMLDTRKHCLDVEADERLCQSVLSIIDSGSLLKINSVLEDSLLPTFATACHSSKKGLIKALNDKHQLMMHISLMRKHFLMESGDAMFTFYTEVFRKIIEGEKWQSNTYLNIIFRDSLSLDDCNSCKGFFLYINDDEEQSSESTTVDGLDKLYLSYDVEWPISVVLNGEIQSIYCRIFRLLMYVKCAKYCLDDLYCFPLICKKKRTPKIIKWWVRNLEISEEQIIHGMYILRMKLLHFVNGYHSYIMTRILHSSGLELNKKLEEADSLDDILLAHREYVYSLQESCLLNANHLYLREHIDTILGLAVKFQNYWKFPIENINIEAIKLLEQQYSSSINFLMSYLNKPRKRGEHLHLEALANAVFTKFQHQQVFSK